MADQYFNEHKYLDLHLSVIADTDQLHSILSPDDHHLFSSLVNNQRFTGVSRVGIGDPSDEAPMVFQLPGALVGAGTLPVIHELVSVFRR
ncbi:hypothetical protein HAX54_027783 [Datura stramonium]|uniref:Uncharacterized protein n=1 Tax=Datura stramonium TaxID=4076 RepID=A0ABS8V325_DATST|nr:hypothetical protein [Datura stramonium]